MRTFLMETKQNGQSRCKEIGTVIVLKLPIEMRDENENTDRGR